MIALFVALGGVSYGLAGKNTVTSDDIVNGAVKSKDIKNSGVKSKDINLGGVKSSDVANDTLVGEDINENTLNKVPRASEADKATNADNLGGVGPGGYQTTANLLFGTLTTSAAGIDLVPARSRGVVSATRIATGLLRRYVQSRRLELHLARDGREDDRRDAALHRDCACAGFGGPDRRGRRDLG